MTYDFSYYDDHTSGRSARARERLGSGAPGAFDSGWLALRRGPADNTALRLLVELARDHGHPDVIVWGPTLVRAVLAGDEAGHRERTLEERHRMVDVLRRLVHHNHAELGIEPAWFAATLAAIEECRGPFLAGALSQAEVEHERRLAALCSLAGGQEPSELDLAPLPSEDLDLTDVRADLHERLRMLDGLVRVAVADLTPGIDELLTAARRLLRRAALGNPEMFARPSSDLNLAAGIAGAVAFGNGIPDARNRVCRSLGIRPGSIQRIPAVLRAAGARLETPPQPLPEGSSAAWHEYHDVLADPALQTYRTRHLIDEAYALVRGEATPPPQLHLVGDSGGEE